MGNQIETNAQGGKGSVTTGAFDCGFPFEGVLEVSKVSKGGAKRYTANNWRRCPAEEHFNHAYEHLTLAGFVGEDVVDGESRFDHIAHAACRLLMALSVMKPGYRFKWQDLPPVVSNQQPGFVTGIQQLQPQGGLPPQGYFGGPWTVPDGVDWGAQASSQPHFKSLGLKPVHPQDIQ